VSGVLGVMQQNLTQINATLDVILTLGRNLDSLYALFNQVVRSSITSVNQSHSLRKRLKASRALHGHSSQIYGASPAIWDHTVLPAKQ